ncbi:MAG TPA: hypothetical protein VES67_01680, partial [Vicinamibacterales bacterium]|nr:hypothetical protein [Vicinamibacterales bacterium]
MKQTPRSHRHARQIGFARQHGGNRFAHRVSGECALARQHLVQNHAEGPHVRPPIHGPAFRLLGRHVRRRAEDQARLRHRGSRECRGVHRVRRRARRIRAERFGETKIEHLHRAVVAHLDVRGFEIAVNDARVVRGFERFGDLTRDGEGFVEWERAACETLRQILALDQFHHQGAILNAVDRRDVGMIERREHL